MKNVLSVNTQSRSVLSAPHVTRGCVLVSKKFQKQRTARLRALEGRRVTSKSQGVQTETRDLPGGTEGSNILPMRGHCHLVMVNCAPIIFSQKI